MAIIIDFAQENKRKFREWVLEYLDLPDDMETQIDILIAFLIENSVFSLAEIRAEMKQRNIVIHEQYYERAAMLAEKWIAERNGE